MGEGFNDDYIYRTLKFIQSYIIFTVLPVLRSFGSTLILICKVFFIMPISWLTPLVTGKVFVLVLAYELCSLLHTSSQKSGSSLRDVKSHSSLFELIIQGLVCDRIMLLNCLP